ncbi:MAG: endolytic transglycosylase MltG, partial [Solirubrobacteraceae bacterium]|nr:endolytic transglycosylase MltG [Solirubrobacteraceae bacterium]
IDPEPPAQPVAPAFDLPDHRQVAVHRRRSFAGRATTRTVVSPPGDANMGGSLGRGRTRRRKLALLVVFLFLGAVAWSQWTLWQPLKGSGGEEIAVSIPEGSGASEVGQTLQDAGVIDSARLFTLRAVIAGQREDLPAGEVKLNRDMSYGAALAKLNGATVNPLDLQSVTIPEGLSIREIAARFKRQNTVDGYGATAVKVLRERREELRADYGVPKNARTLEGLLFPATYELPAGFTARDLIDRQLQAFEQNFGSVSMARAKKANLTPYDVLTIASLVEREARLTRERPLIAAVIYNRLKAGMPLGIDATFRYASGNWNDPIRQSELDKDGPFNSRTRTGLPPTPIGNPGLASIEAAAAPAKVDYLYFVVKPGRCGEHAFAATAEKFAQDSAKYNAAREAAGGSPDTC